MTAITKSTVILVDDDRSILRALRRLLTSVGFEVMTFERPSAVLAATLPVRDACLVIDIHLPEMDGAELYAALRAAGCMLPVVAITGARDEATQRLIPRLGASATLYKPFEREALIQAVKAALSRGPDRP